MENPKNIQCYCCDQIATTQDHIPPKCFFPKKKHLPSDSSDYRKNLITVPSCSAHNNSRSKDDEYTAAIIAMNSESDIAFSMFKSKWVQVLLRNEGMLGQRMFSTARSVRYISKQNGVLIPSKTLAVSYEIERIECVIKSIARGIYYIESNYKEKWVGKCDVKSPKFLNRNLSKPQSAFYLNKINKAFLIGETHKELQLTKRGEQSDVFFYQIIKLDEKHSIIKMVFYKDFIFFVSMKE